MGARRAAKEHDHYTSRFDRLSKGYFQMLFATTKAILGIFDHAERAKSTTCSLIGPTTTEESIR
jgi:hypothetical protein